MANFGELIKELTGSMAIYRFRVEVEDVDGVYREIDIKSTQTFEDFHFALLKSYAFDFKHPASFFYSDDLWHREDEIAFNFEAFEHMSSAQAMNKAKISDFIDDPHQRFLYLYFCEDETFTFLIELIDIQTTDKPAQTLPTMVKSVGEAPKQYKQRITFKPKKEDSAPAAPIIIDPVVSAVDDDDDLDVSSASDDALEVFEGFETNTKGLRDAGSIDLDDDILNEKEDEDAFDDDEEEDVDDDEDQEDDYNGYGKSGRKGRNSDDYDDDY
jgi:hypothetical protein